MSAMVLQVLGQTRGDVLGPLGSEAYKLGPCHRNMGRGTAASFQTWDVLSIGTVPLAGRVWRRTGGTVCENLENSGPSSCPGPSRWSIGPQQEARVLYSFGAQQDLVLITNFACQRRQTGLRSLGLTSENRAIKEEIAMDCTVITLVLSSPADAMQMSP